MREHEFDAVEFDFLRYLGDVEHVGPACLCVRRHFDHAAAIKCHEGFHVGALETFAAPLVHQRQFGLVDQACHAVADRMHEIDRHVPDFIARQADVGHRAIRLGAPAAIGVGRNLVDLRVRLHDVVAFHEGLHRKFPVGRQLGGIPPVHLEFMRVARVHPVRHRAEAVAQGLGIVVEVDEGAARPFLAAHRHKVDLGMGEQFFGEDLPAVNESVFALCIPSPAVEWANQAVLGAVARAVGEPYAAMAAGVEEGLHAVFAAHDDHRLVEDGIFHIVADVWNFLEPGGHLPYLRPQPLLFELEERLVIIARGRDQLRIGHAQRNNGKRLCNGIGHDYPQPEFEPDSVPALQRMQSLDCILGGPSITPD